MPLTQASEIMNFSAALMNDTELEVYTYAKQLPYLQMAFRELSEMLELADVPVTHKVDATITVPIGMSAIGYSTFPALPGDLITIQNLFLSSNGAARFSRLIPVNYVPTSSDPGVWNWSNNRINIALTTALTDLKIEYIASLIGNIVDQNSVIGVVNGASFLQFRTASLCAQFIGENKERSDELNMNATQAFDRAVGIETKSKQVFNTRRRPFRASYKRGGY